MAGKPGFYNNLTPQQQQAYQAAKKNLPGAARPTLMERIKENKWAKYVGLPVAAVAGVATLPFWGYPAATAAALVLAGKKAYEHRGDLGRALLHTPRAMMNMVRTTYHGAKSLFWTAFGLGVAILAGAVFFNTNIDVNNNREVLDSGAKNTLSAAREANKFFASIGRFLLPAGSKALDKTGDAASSAANIVDQCVSDDGSCIGGIADAGSSAASSAGKSMRQSWLNGWQGTIEWYYGLFGVKVGNIVGAENSHKTTQAKTSHFAAPAKPSEYSKAPGSVRQALLARGQDLYGSREIVSCTEKFSPNRSIDGPTEAQQNQYLDDADEALNRAMADKNSALVKAIEGSQTSDVRVLSRAFYGSPESATLEVHSFTSKHIPVPEGTICRGYPMKDFLEGSGMNPGLKTPTYK
jgi:hypothetical protein